VMEPSSFKPRRRASSQRKGPTAITVPRRPSGPRAHAAPAGSSLIDVPRLHLPLTRWSLRKLQAFRATSSAWSPKARGHSPATATPDDNVVVKLLWLAIINIEDKRARERAARRQITGKRSDQPARLAEGQRAQD
jgi:hypothetical protein